MSGIRTPNNLEVLIHCHVSPCEHPRFDAPAVQEALRELTNAGLIYPRANKCGNIYATTKKGAFLLEHLLSVPLPIEETIFIIPERQVV